MAGDRQLDPQIAGLIEAIAAMGPFEDLSPNGRRQISSRVVQLFRGPASPSFSDVSVNEDDLVVGAKGTAVPVRRYRASSSSGDHVIVFFHGGGWVAGNLPDYDYDMRRMAARTGCQVLACEYRLAPENPFPSPYEDCLAVARRALEMHGAQKVSIAGDSAGGNLALSVALTLADEGVEMGALLLLYPAIDPRALENETYEVNGEGFLLTRPDMKYYYDSYLSHGQHDNDWRAAPGVRDDLRGLPPTTLVTAGFDPLLGENLDLARKLIASDVELSYLPNPALTHGFQQMACTVDAAAKALDRAYDAFSQSVHSRSMLHRPRSRNKILQWD